MRLITGPPHPGTTSFSLADAAFSNAALLYPMTRTQLGLWAEFQSDPTHTKYNLSLRCTFNAEGVPEASSMIGRIYEAVRHLTQRHAMLRSSFHAAQPGRLEAPFVMEHIADSFNPVIQTVVVTHSKRDAVLIPILHSPINITDMCAVRWVIAFDPAAPAVDIYLCAHHIALDGCSMAFLSDELATLVDSPATPATVRPPFSCATQMEQAFMASEAYKLAADFWLSQLAQVQPIVWKAFDSSTQGSRSPEVSQVPYRSIQDWATFSQQELVAWGTQYKTSWFRLIIAVVGLTIRQVSETQPGADHAVTVAFGGRTLSTALSIGNFANAMPIRVPLAKALNGPIGSSNGTILDLVKSISKQLSVAKKHDRFSFADLARIRNRGGVAMLTPQVAVTLSPKLSRDEFELFPVEGPYELLFCLLEGRDTVELGVIYDPKVFSVDTMSLMKSTFLQLRNLSTENPQVGLADIHTVQDHLPHLLPPVDFNNEAAISKARFIGWFEAQAHHYPERTALTSAERNASISYGDLNASANRMAKHLISKGIVAGNVVLLHLARGFPVMEWILAVMKSGAAFAVIDQSHPLERSVAVLELAEPSILVDDGEGKDLATAAKSAQVDVIETQQLNLPPTWGDEVHVTTADDDLTYIVFTSGSTGKPKAVEVEHRNLSHFVADAFAAGYCALGAGSRTLQFSNFAFDAAVLEWAQTLAVGGTLCFADVPAGLVGSYLADVIELNNISFMHVTPSVLATLPRERALPSLMQISVGGEMVPQTLLDAWRERVSICNAYGPTECTVVMAHRPQSGPGISSGDVGRPHPHTAFHVLSDDMTALPLTAVSVAVNEESQTLVAFIAPADSEGVLAGVAKVLPRYMVPSKVIALDDLPRNANDKRNLLQHAPNLRIIDLFKHATLEAQANFLAQASVPASSSNKTKGCSSRRHTIAISPVAEDVHEVEAAMVSVWSSLLNKSNLDSNANFFELGGNSLIVPRLLSSIRQRWPTSTIKLTDIFRHATIASQARLINLGLSLEPVAARPSTRLVKTSSRKASILADEKVAAKTSTRKKSVLADDEVSDAIAIIGIAGRFPGANSADEFFDVLLSQQEALSDVPLPSSPSSQFPGAIHVARRGTLKNLDGQCNKLVPLRPADSENMDPQQRIFIEVAAEALEDAGQQVSHDHEVRNRIGLCVGSTRSTWLSGRIVFIFARTFLTPCKVSEPVGKDGFYAAHRMALTPSASAQAAYHLNLQGPNITVNTACSSGLVALAQSVSHLRAKDCDLSVAGGVSIDFPQEGYTTAEGKIFSPSGHCRPFDHRADGGVPADGVCAVVLKRLDDAITDQDQIYGVIAGVATGSDGLIDKTELGTPSPRGQFEVIKSAWTKSGVRDPQDVYVELHGSGTAIGDALELEALSLAKLGLGLNGNWIVGSNKGNIGNCEAASGLASLVKICKSIESGTIPPMLDFERPNPIIDPGFPFGFANRPVSVSRSHVFAVSSSGYGGVNAHCVVTLPPSGLSRSSRGRSLVKLPDHQAVSSMTASVSSQVPVSDIAASIVTVAAGVMDLPLDQSTDLRAHGLTSLKQIQVVQKLRTLRPELHLPISAFAQDSVTPLSLAARVQGVTGPKTSTPASSARPAAVMSSKFCTILHSGDASSVYALIAPAGGSCAGFVDFTKYEAAADNSRTVVSLEHPHFCRNDVSIDETLSIEHLASVYSKELLAVLPQLTHLTLVGASFGGVIAHEMVEYLSPHGVVLEKMVLLDSPCPSTYYPGHSLPCTAFLSNVLDVSVLSIYDESDAKSPFNVDEQILDTMKLKDLNEVLEGLTLGVEHVLERMSSAKEGQDVRQVIASYDWRTLARVYVENVLALADFASDVRALSAPRTVDVSCQLIFVGRSEAPCGWQDMYQDRLLTLVVEGTHAGVCKGENAAQAPQQLNTNLHGELKVKALERWNAGTLDA
ncbi:hypothetical protein B0H15DRAFT_797266 [Mycena belliarum]|uniref:Non-ribosomal peptide synthetase n=1 Tax=Mycena belliarum TaxID=1033014 RepID=A0AAD6UIY4_9AGAR|nr:hypothetical protein B0H15DRAFT_797266 [Mycena belliae]